MILSSTIYLERCPLTLFPGIPLDAALASLEPDQRAILVLRDVQGLDYDQIAAALELAGGTVKSRLFRARVALREALEKLESEKLESPDKDHSPRRHGDTEGAKEKQ